MSRGPQVLPEGTEIGQRYRLVKLLGRGGMGAVYLAKDSELDRDVALKFIRDDIADSPETLQRFKREITLSSQITNRNVLRVYDLGEADGVKFVTMQYVEGEDLAGRLRREGALLGGGHRCRPSGRSATGSPPPTSKVSSTATSSRRTSCSTRRAVCTSPTSASPSCSARPA